MGAKHSKPKDPTDGKVRGWIARITAFGDGLSNNSALIEIRLDERKLGHEPIALAIYAGMATQIAAAIVTIATGAYVTDREVEIAYRDPPPHSSAPSIVQIMLPRE